MKRTMLAAIALLGILVTAAAAAQEPKPIKGQGCVAAGVEASCLVVKDVKTGVLYNLFFKGTRPDVGTGIEFTGVPSDKMTICMQGTPLEVSHWSRVDSLKCSSSPAPKP
jgi:adenine deaminase